MIFFLYRSSYYWIICFKKVIIKYSQKEENILYPTVYYIHVISSVCSLSIVLQLRWSVMWQHCLQHFSKSRDIYNKETKITAKSTQQAIGTVNEVENQDWVVQTLFKFKFQLKLNWYLPLLEMYMKLSIYT